MFLSKLEPSHFYHGKGKFKYAKNSVGIYKINLEKGCGLGLLSGTRICVEIVFICFPKIVFAICEEKTRNKMAQIILIINALELLYRKAKNISS